MTLKGDYKDRKVDNERLVVDYRSYDFSECPPLYKDKHSEDAARLSLNFTRSLDMPSRTQAVVYFAAAFHDAGRREPWGAEDPCHAERGAAIFDRYYRSAQPERWHDTGFREEVCRLIVQHKADGVKRADLLANILHDVDCLESLRINKLEGLSEADQQAYIKKQLGKLVLPLAQQRGLARAWAEHHGW